MDVIKGVYCLTSPSGKKYVGIGCGKRGVQGRFSDYKNYLCKNQTKLYNALKKYGSENFKYEILLITNDLEYAKYMEQTIISSWNLQNEGYNITAGGEGCLGLKHNEESKRKMSLAKKGKKLSKDHKKKIGDLAKGRKHSEESKIRMSQVQKGRKVSEETKQKLSDANLGKKLSEDHKKKIGNGNKGKIVSEESKLKMSKSRSAIKKIKNIITGEIFEGSFRQLSEKLNLDLHCLRTNIVKYGKYKDWIIL
jgi:group I intron endonuclease